MNLTHLRYIVEVARHGSVTKAAAKLYIGQPNLSKIIKDTESALGITIFRRTSKGVVPTAAGSEFISHAEAAIAEIEQIEKLSGGGAGRIMLPPDYPAEQAKELIKGGAHSFEISAGSTSEALNAVARAECDLAVIRFPAHSEEAMAALFADKALRGRKLAEYDIAVLVGESSPIAAATRVSGEQLMALTEIVREGEPSSGCCITVSCGVDIYGLLLSLPQTFFLSPPLPDGKPESKGLRQIPLADAERCAEYLIEKA